MSKEILSVAEVLNNIKPNPEVKENGKRNLARFSQKSFNDLMRAMLNDTDFTTKVALTSKGELKSVEEIKVTEGFRKFLQKVLEKAGIDKNESAIVLTKDFTFDNVDGLYEFFATAMYEYMCEGAHRFDLLPKEDFKASIGMKYVDAKTKKGTLLNPSTGETLGTYQTDMKPHWEATVKSGCPNWMKTRLKNVTKK